MNNLSQQQTQELECILYKFFSDPTLNNEERRSLEKWLAEKFGGPSSWQIGLSLLVNTQSSSTPSYYLSFFGLHLIENAVKNRNIWEQLTMNNKNEMKMTLFNMLLNYKRMNASICTKLCSILVNIAKIEWPEQWPQFLPKVMEMCSNQNTIIVGLTLLQSMSEEFVTDKEDVTSMRRQQLKNSLKSEVRKILDFLNQVLESLWMQYGQNSGGAAFVQNNELANIVTLSLKCIAQYLTWIPHDINYVRSSLLNVIFTYTTTNSEMIKIQALNCFIELLGKNDSSVETQTLMMECYKHMLNIINNFLTKYSTITDTENANPEYLEKIALLQHFFIQNHLHRLESNINFPIMQFFSMFYNFTFIQPLTEQFLFCLDSLAIFLEFLQNEMRMRDKKSFQSLIQKYQEALMAFSASILKRSQFLQMGSNYFLELDDEKLDQDGLTEIDQYLNQCIEVIGTIGDLYFDSLVPQIHTIFFNLSTQLVKVNKVPLLKSFDAMSTSEQSIYSICRDLITFLRIYGRLSEKFVQTFDATARLCMQFINENIHLATILLNDALHSHGKIYSKLLQDLFGSLLMFNNWMRVLSTKQENQADFEKLLSLIFDCISKAFDPSTNSTIDVLNGCTALLLSLFYNFSDFPLTGQNSYKLLIQNLPQLTQYIVTRFRFEDFDPILTRLYAAISNSILLKQLPKASAVASQHQLLEWQKENYSQFIQSYLGKQFQQILVMVGQSQFMHPTVMTYLPIILSLAKSIVDSVHDKSKIIKNIVYENLKFLIDALLSLFRVYVNFANVLHLLLGLMLSIFNSLLGQVGTDFILQTVESFLSLLTKDAIQRFASENNGRLVLINFLELLNALMADGSNRFLSITGKVLDICKDIIYPVIMPDNSSTYASKKISIDVLSKYYTLLFTILHSNWKYFFDAQQQFKSRESMMHFSFIFECFLQSFRLPDVQLFKDNLKLLEELNNSRKLYQRPVFIDGMMSAFLKVFFDALIAKSHTLIQDDIINASFHMAQSDWSAFENFLPQYLSSANLNEKHTLSLQQYLIVGSQHLPLDIHNPVKFSQNMNSFLNDLRYCLQSSRACSSLLLGL